MLAQKLLINIMSISKIHLGHVNLTGIVIIYTTSLNGLIISDTTNTSIYMAFYVLRYKFVTFQLSIYKVNDVFNDNRFLLTTRGNWISLGTNSRFVIVKSSVIIMLKIFYKC